MPRLSHIRLRPAVRTTLACAFFAAAIGVATWALLGGGAQPVVKPPMLAVFSVALCAWGVFWLFLDRIQRWRLARIGLHPGYAVEAARVFAIRRIMEQSPITEADLPCTRTITRAEYEDIRSKAGRITYGPVNRWSHSFKPADWADLAQSPNGDPKQGPWRLMLLDGKMRLAVHARRVQPDKIEFEFRAPTENELAVFPPKRQS